MYIVYKHTCPNGKVYIGITGSDVNDRWKNGLGYKRNEHFYRAIEKYGWDNIKHEILFDNLSKEKAEQIEIDLIFKYKSSNKAYGYNCTNGGECVGKHTDETKQKISEKNKGRAHAQTEETKEKIRQQHLGRQHTTETKTKISNTKKGQRQWTDEERQKMSERNRGERNPNYGKHHSDQTKEKLRMLKLGKYKKAVLCVETNVIYPSAIEVEKILGLCKTSISRVCRGKSKTCGGYH